MKSPIVILICLSLVAANEIVLQTFNPGNHLFSAAVYKELLLENDGNFLVCPFSIETILALVQSGARGETGAEVRKVLNLPNNTTEVEAIFKNLLTTLRNNKNYAFRMANKIYVKLNYSIKEEFLKISKDVYRASVTNINFSRKRRTVELINEWVARKTENKIHDIISMDSLTEDTVGVVINALYFKGVWTRAFKNYLTKQENFHKTLDNVVQVPTMHKRDFFRYSDSLELDAKFLELPFKGRNVKMVFVLPNKKDGLGVLASQMDKVLATEFTTAYVHVALPKFKIETTINFKEILKNLGVKKVFAHGDLSGIAGEPGDVVISDILQKTFISLDENGVEAAAASAVYLQGKSLMDYMGKEKEFIADHPFLFYLTVKDIIVFIGRVTSPTY